MNDRAHPFLPMTGKPRLVLHIGMHKTGSTSLQRFFARNRLLLRWCGIDYPRAIGANGRRLPKHNDLFHAISHEKDHGEPHPVLGSSADRIAKIAASLKPGRVTVLSAEGFSGEDPAFAAAFAPLREVADVRVVCFLRRQDDWVRSFYKQMVLSREVRETKSFEEFVAMRSTRKHIDYASILGWWAESLGRRNIRVVIYPPQRSMMLDFLEAAELPLWLRHLPFSHCIQNRGRPSGYIERVRVANESDEERPELAPSDRDEAMFRGKSRRELMDSCEEGNEWIRAKFRPDLERLFPEA